MGFLDALTGRHKLSGPAPDRLFAITTAAVTLESSYGIVSTGTAAIVFQPLATSEFESTLKDMEEVVRSTGSERGLSVSSKDDDYGFRWMVMHDGGVEDLAVGINAVSDSIELAGHGERLLCAVFAFSEGSPGSRGTEGDGGAAGTAGGGRRIHFIYNYKRGLWYPFVPAGPNQRSTERELQLKAQIGSELPLEGELERWFPLWGIPI